MESFEQRIATLDLEIEKTRKKELELFKKRETMLCDETARYVEASQPSAATQIAQALIAVHTEHDVMLETLFGVQCAEVNTAGLLLRAEYRDAFDIEMFLKHGADVNAKDKEGFSVLEKILQGHSYHSRFPENWNKEVFDVIADYNVDRSAVEGWIIEERCSEAPQYVRDFLGV